MVHSCAAAAIRRCCRCSCSCRNGSRCHRCGGCCCCCCCTAAPKWADGSTRASWTGRAAVAGKSACPTRSVYLSTCIQRVMQFMCGVSERSIRITFDYQDRLQTAKHNIILENGGRNATRRIGTSVLRDRLASLFGATRQPTMRFLQLFGQNRSNIGLNSL